MKIYSIFKFKLFLSLALIVFISGIALADGDVPSSSTFKNDIFFKSKTTEQLQIRQIYDVIELDHYFKKSSLHVKVPFSLNKIRVLNEDTYETLSYLMLENIAISYGYKPEIFGNRFNLGLTGTLPTRRILHESANVSQDHLTGQLLQKEFSEDNLKKTRVFSLTPQITYKKILDPIVMYTTASVCVPLWNEARDENLYKNISLQLSHSTNFIINNEITFFTELGFTSTKIDNLYTSDAFLVRGGIDYRSSGSSSMQLQLSNVYLGGIWEPMIGVSISSKFQFFPKIKSNS